MKIITCPNCDSKFDASSFEPGSKFECLSCKNVMIVPAEVVETLRPVAPPRQRPEGLSDPTARPKSRPGPSRPAPRRQGRAPSRGRPAPAPRPEPKARPRPEPKARPRPEPKARPRPEPKARPRPEPKACPRPEPKARPRPEPRRPASRPASRPVPAQPARQARPAPSAPSARGRTTASPARAPARPMREERGGRRRSGPEPRSSSSTPIMLGLAGLGLVVIVVVIVFALGGDGDEPKTPDQPIVHNEKPEPRPVESNDPAIWDMTRKSKHWNQLKLNAIGIEKEKAIALLRKNAEWAEKYGLPIWVETTVKSIIKLDPQDAWANPRRGYKLFEYEFMPEIHDMPEEMYPYSRKSEITDVARHGENGNVWVSPEDFDLLTKLQEEERAHLKRIDEDPKYKWTKHWIQFTRKHPIYNRYQFTTSEEFPYLIFVQKTGEQKDEAEATRIVQRDAKVFKALVGAFTDKFEPEIRKLPGRGDFEMPRFDETSWGEVPILKIWVFFSHKDFVAYQRAIRHPLPPGVRAYYMPGDQWITLYEGRAERGESQKIGGQDFNTGKTFHEGVHQLIHYYSRLLLSKKLGERVDWKDRRIDCRSHWFQEGLAEFVGAADPKSDGKWEILSIHHRRLREFRGVQRMHKANAKSPIWTLNELLRITTRGDLLQKCAAKARAAGNVKRFSGILSSLLYAHGWLYCHFLWHYDNGKYRAKFMEYMARELTGETGFNVWKDVMKDVVPDGDFSEMEKELMAYEKGLKGL